MIELSGLSTIDLVIVLMTFFATPVLITAFMINIWITDYLSLKHRWKFIQRQIDLYYSEMRERERKRILYSNGIKGLKNKDNKEKDDGQE